MRFLILFLSLVPLIANVRCVARRAAGVLDTVVLSRAKQYIRDFTTIERFASQDLVVLSDEEMKDTGNPLLAI